MSRSLIATAVRAHTTTALAIEFYADNSGYKIYTNRTAPDAVRILLDYVLADLKTGAVLSFEFV